jgi:hypothetical protein
MVVLCNALEFALSCTLFNADNVGACVVEVLVVEVLSWTIPAPDVLALGIPVRSLHGRLPLKDVAVTVPAVTVPVVVRSVPSDEIVLGASKPSASVHTKTLLTPRLTSSTTRDAVLALRVSA